MSEAAATLDGWYSLHDMRTMNWASWKTLSTKERDLAVHELQQFLNKLNETQTKEQGSHAFYTVIGQKADFMLWYLRPTMEEVHELENEFNKLTIAEHTLPAYSYVSVVELSNYLAGESNEDPYQNPYVRARLYPALPKSKFICFYPMDKRRDGDDNWYMLDMASRRELMKAHGLTGRKYAGKVKQFITGSVGFDDYEWGVTLLADDILQFKKLVYEMRFDEVSARYADFGSFFVGAIIDTEQDVQKFFYVKEQQ